MFYQLNIIWVHGAGWRDVRVPFQKGKIKFCSADLLGEWKKIMQRFVWAEKPRPVRAMVPRPSQLSCAKPMPSLGDELCDALQHREQALKKEQERLDKLHDVSNIPRRRDSMPDLRELELKRVGMVFSDEDEDDAE